MREETAERLIQAFNGAAAKVSDQPDMESAVDEVARFLLKVLAALRKFRSAEQVRRDLLQMEEPSPFLVTMFEATLRYTPKLFVRWTREHAVRHLKATAETGRRPSVSEDSYWPICMEISALELRGQDHAQAKREVARRYRVATRTISRIWNGRATYPKDGITEKEAATFLASELGIQARMDMS